MRRMLIAAVVVVAASTGLGACGEVRNIIARAAGLPTDKNILFWTDPQRARAFRMMERLTDAHAIAAGGTPYPLTPGKPIAPTALKWQADGKSWTIDSFMEDQHTAGLVVVQRGEIRLERYGLGYDEKGKWTSFSVAKSFTSTLVGAAIRDGHIKSLGDPVTRYIPELAGSGYDGVSIEQLLTMRSGVRWNEDYADPKSDVALFNAQEAEGDIDPVTAYMRKLPSEAAPGTRWHYNTGETNLVGVLVEKAVHKSLSDYLSEKVWKPFGMEADAAWLLNSAGHEIAGCCVSARLRDYARFGIFVLQDGRVGGKSGESGKSVVPEGWFEAAGHKQADIGDAGRGYGYFWWTYDDGSFAAQGIFGQGIFIDPKRQLVIASNGNWPIASDKARGARRTAFYRAVQAAVDRDDRGPDSAKPR